MRSYFLKGFRMYYNTILYRKTFREKHQSTFLLGSSNLRLETSFKTVRIYAILVLMAVTIWNWREAAFP